MRLRAHRGLVEQVQGSHQVGCQPLSGRAPRQNAGRFIRARALERTILCEAPFSKPLSRSTMLDSAILLKLTTRSLVAEADSGAWGPWSPWSACTSTCGGGTRNRYRFCDSPPPRYGAKFCEVRQAFCHQSSVVCFFMFVSQVRVFLRTVAWLAPRSLSWDGCRTMPSRPTRNA